MTSGANGTTAFVIDRVTIPDTMPLAASTHSFTIQATGGMTMSTVEFQTSNAAVVDMRAILVGGLTTASPVPEPSTLLSGLPGAAALLVVRRRQRRA